MELLAWYNLIFVAPVGLAAVYLALSATGLGDLGGEADTDADFDHDVDLDMDHDVDLDLDHDLDLDLDHDVDLDLDHDVDLDMDHDVDLDLDHDVDLDLDHDVDLDMDHDVDIDMDHDVDVAMEHDVDADFDHDVDADLDHDIDVETEAEADLHAEVAHDVQGAHHLGAEHEVHDGTLAHHEASMLVRALSVLGVGKVPVSILMTCLMVIFGATGLIANGLFESALPWSWAPAVYVWPSLALALLTSVSLTGTVASGLHRLMPTKETYAITEEELVGQVGVSVYGITDGRRGPVNVKDIGGTLHQVMGRTMDGAVAKSTEVLLVRYHREEDYYDVAASPLSAIAGSAQENIPASSSARDRATGGTVAQDVSAAKNRERTSSTQS